ncbi:hypothetical protein [Brumimicrobium aurantiacum]|uniref:Uncharacterized protein n=1 Tax=Brumimicrobium aurantiacum TaxID=1737063 RepID=A0A3E1EYP4_9FLAO|nr:hypothetical protein [Brumimicrobium aurantiacum]RFC54603.1 hypothetical protein DXU93_06335 [Brumimicrobium aurantiacum]
MKNIFLLLIVAVYSLSVSSAVNTLQLENSFSLQGTEKVHFSDFSKIIFPQVVTADGHNLSGGNQFQFDDDLDQSFFSIQCLSQLYGEYSLKAIKLSRNFDLQFPSIDIIFPFHYFW